MTVYWQKQFSAIHLHIYDDWPAIWSIAVLFSTFRGVYIINKILIKFETIDEFLDFLPGNERILVEQLREIVFECIPNVKEKLSYNVPYFYGKKRICFLWPSSIPWGNVKKDGVLLGFCQGHLLNDELNFLAKGGRKQVFTKTYQSSEEIDEQLLRNYLFKAAEIDELS